MPRSEGVRLSGAELRAVVRTQEVLLDPFGFEDYEAWCRASMSVWGEAVGADQVLMAVPHAAVGIGGLASDPQLIAAVDAYSRDWVGRDIVMQRIAEAGTPPVYHRDEYYADGERSADPLYSEWSTPYRLFDTLGMGLDMGGPMPALIHAYADREGGRLARRVHLAHLVAPAFRAGVRGFLALHEARDSLAARFDLVSQGLVLQGVERTQTANRAARLLLADEQWGERVGAMLERLLQRSGGEPGPAGPFSAQVGPIRLEAFHLAVSGVGPSRLTAVVLTDHRLIVHEPASVRDLLGLTDRQAEVAVLMAARFSDKAIAQRLGIKVNTVRRHAEAVLGRAGVSSREALAELIRRKVTAAESAG